MKLQVTDLSFGYGKEPVLSGITFGAEGGTVTALLGQNGAGKSTLLRVLDGILPGYTGTVTLEGEDLRALSPASRARRIAYVPQQVRFGDGTVFDAVMLGRRPFRGVSRRGEDEKKTAAALELLDIGHLAARRVRTLSGGEARRVALARALCGEPEVLLLDEPTNDLDPRGQAAAAEILRRVSSSGAAVIVSLHDLNLALRAADRFLLVAHHAVLAQGDASALTKENLAAVYGIPVSVVMCNGRPVAITEG